MEQMAAFERGAGSPHKEIVLVLRPESAPTHKADAGRSDLEFPAEFRVPVLGTRQYEQPRECLLGRVGDQRGRPSDLLQPEIGTADAGIGPETGLDGLVLGDARDRPPDLDPAAILA